MTLLDKLLRRGSPAASPNGAATGRRGGEKREHDASPNADEVRRVIQEIDGDIAAGELAQALETVDGALAKSPSDTGLRATRAAVLFAWGRVYEAYRTFTRISPIIEDAARLREFAWACFSIPDLDAAAAHMRHSIRLAPDNQHGYVGLGILLRAQARIADAQEFFERGLTVEPGQPDCLLHLADICKNADDLQGAEGLLRRLIQFDSKHIGAWTDLGIVLGSQNRHLESLEAYSHVAHLEQREGRQVDGFVNLGISLRDSGRIGDALDLYRSSLAAHHSVDGGFGYSILLLITGRLREGWHFAEFRWLRQPSIAMRPRFGLPCWDGQSLSGKHILLCAEQGAGDVIQFIRYAGALKSMGAVVHVAPFDGLFELLKGLKSIDRLVADKAPVPNLDYYIHLQSLPRVFDTELTTIPAEVPYLHADAVRVESWASRLAGGEGVKVGLVWAGNPLHTNDRFRSMRLEMLQPLWEVAGVRFISLQKGAPAGQIRELPPVLELLDLGPDLKDFSDTAAVIAQLDLVVCVDTAVAHLAGALGKPVWVMLATPNDWRWMEKREDSPWYPTMRLFRQAVRNEWSGVVERVKAALEERVRRGPPPPLPVRAQPVLQPVARLPRDVPGHQPGFSAVAECRDGILQYLPDEPLEGDALGWYGEYLQQQLDLLAQMIRPGSTVMEVGAGIGAHTLFLGAAVGKTGHLFLYESRPVQQRILRQNVEANGIGPVTLMRRALGRPQAPEGLSPGATPIRETLDELRLEELHWLKINAGAHALEVLEGADTLWRLRPKLFLEARDEAQLAALADRARSASYRCWRMEVPLYNPENFNRRDSNIFGEGTALALLAIPEEVEVDIPLNHCMEMR